MNRVSLQPATCGAIAKVASYLAARDDSLSQGILWSTVGPIQVITQNLKPEQPLPEDVIRAALDDVTGKGKGKVLVMRLFKYEPRGYGDNEKIFIGTINKFEEEGKDQDLSFKLDFNLISYEDPKYLIYVCRFLQAEELVKVHPYSHHSEGELDTKLYNSAPSPLPLNIKTLTVGNILSIGIFPKVGNPKGGSRMTIPMSLWVPRPRVIGRDAA